MTTSATCSAQRTLVKSVTTVQPSCPVPIQPTVDTIVTSTSTTTIYETKTASMQHYTETVVSTKLVKSIITIQPLCTALPNIAEKATSDVNVGVNPQSSLQEMIASSQNKPTVILGALLGLFVLVIVVMIIGWVWTYWNFKKRSQKVKSSASNG